MAAPGSSMGFCKTCHLPMHIRDFHSECLECLSISHDTGECDSCKNICVSIISCRLKIVGEAVTQGKWPSDWRQRLSIMENFAWATPSAHEEEEVILSPDSSEGEN